MRIKIFEPWVGELGWELQHHGYARKISREFQHTIITTFPGMDMIYKDFAEVMHHDRKDRSLYHGIPYRVQGEWVKFGTPEHKADILIHARGMRRGDFKNYKGWDKVSKSIIAGFIGSGGDQWHQGIDLRGVPLDKLANYMAGAKVVVGASSGVMHLAQQCGTPVVCWGEDNKTYYGQKLEVRYKETWNRFDSKVTWIPCDNWQPNPDDILKAVRDYV
jgi:hypothetical protein